MPRDISFPNQLGRAFGHKAQHGSPGELWLGPGKRFLNKLFLAELQSVLLFIVEFFLF